MRIKIIYSLLIFIYFNSYTQNLGGCGYVSDETEEWVSKAQNCSNSSSAWINDYRNPAHWTSNNVTPIKTILVNWVVCQKNDGSNGWQDIPQFHQQVNEMFDSINKIYSTVLPKGYSLVCEPTINYITDTRIRFELNEIIFIQNDLFNKGTATNGGGFSILNWLYTNYPETKNQLNHLFTMGNRPGAWGEYVANTLNNAYVMTYGSMFSDGFVVWDDHINHMVHEYGHAVGLHHPYEKQHYLGEMKQISNFDFLDDIFGTCGESYCCSLYTTPTGYMCPLTVDCFWNTATAPLAIMNGTNNQRYISPKQSGRMHRALSLYDNSFVVDNKNMHRYVKEITPSIIPYEITQNETWDFKIKMYQNVIVKSGNTLTIKCEVMMPNDGKIIVEPNAKLIIDGGKITNFYYLDDSRKGYWQGIEVWGTTAQHQFPENNPTYQGYLQLINGGTIENAQNGARNWKPEDWGKIGGVIISDGGIFKNNRRAVEFISYENFSSSNPSIKRGNHSSFTNTDFIWDDNFISGQTYNTMVTMWLVDGINFTNCRFSNLMTGAKTLFDASQNRAIYSIDAGYSILPGCSSSTYPCPTGNLLKSTFTGFKEAVVATGSGTTKTLTISRSTFTNNLLAVDIDDFDNISVDRNSITSGLAGYIFPLSIGGTGIYIRNSTGYIVEENTLTTAMSGRTTYGIRVENSGTANNRLYKNTMTGLSYGQHLTGINKNIILFGGTHTGLQFLCNTYTGNKYAVYVGPAASADIFHGVKIFQGESSKSAGNIFNLNSSADSSVTNRSSWTINYNHNNGNTIPVRSTTNLTLSPTSTNFCLSSFGGIILMKGQSGAALDSLEQQKYNSKMMYDELMYNYLSLLDGGNTEDLKSKIENSWSEDAWLLRGKLLEKSPYLSQEVLLEAAKSGVLPNAMLLEICLANPDATRNVYFVDKLNEATNGTFPDYMKEYISSNDKKTVRTQLELQLAALSSSISSTKHFISNIKATAQEYTYTDRYALVTSGNELSDKISQIDFFMENNQWVKADSVLQTIYEDKKQQDHLKLIENFDIYIAFRSGLGERNLAQLDDSEIIFLQNLAEREGRIAGYAKNILCFFYQICYDEQKLLENDSQKMMMKPQQQLQNLPPLEELTYVLNVYPNPAKEYTNLQWEILDELNSCHYKVHDLSGLLISEGIITQNKGEASIDTRNIKNGMYIISVFNGSKLKTTRKLVVEKIK